MGGELSCPCGRRIDVAPQLSRKADLDILQVVMQGKLSKADILYDYSVNNNLQSTKTYLISSASLERFFANRNLLIIETKHEINYYYNKILICNFLNQESICLILLQYKKGQEDRSINYSKSSHSISKSQMKRAFRQNDYSAVYKVETINFLSNDIDKIKEHILNDLNAQLAREYYLYGIITDPVESPEEMNVYYNHHSLQSQIKNNYKIVYKKSKLNDNLDIRYSIEIYEGKLSTEIITEQLMRNKDKKLKTVLRHSGDGKRKDSYFFCFEGSKITPEYDENEFIVVKIEKEKSSSDSFMKDIAEKVNLQTTSEILLIINDMTGFYIVFRYEMNGMEEDYQEKA